MTIEMRPVRLPKRKLTPAQAAKFAALRAEIESELASSSSERAGADGGEKKRDRKYRRR